MNKVINDLQNVPIDIDDNLNYIDGVNKGVLNVTIKARDEEGQETSITKTKQMFQITDITKETDSFNFSWKFVNKSTACVCKMLEIIDENYDLIAYSEEIEGLYTKNYDIDKVILNPIVFREDKKYYYRVRAYSNDEMYDLYFPDRRGIEILDRNQLRTIFEKNIDGGFSFLDNFIYKKIEEGNLSNETIKLLLRTRTNPIDNTVFRMNGNSDKYKLNSIFSNYAENLDEITHGKKTQFYIKEENHLKSDGFLLEMFVDGKKIFINDYQSQQKFDGLAKTYIRSDLINNNSFIELETYKKYLKDGEKIIAKYTLDTEQDMIDLYSKGIKIYSNKIGAYFRSTDLITFVKFKNSNSWQRVNPYRTKITINYEGEDRFSITVRIKDSAVDKPGNQIMVISNNILKKVFFKVDALNKLATEYQVPCYFLPYSYITDEGDFINDLSNDIENTDIFVNGFRLYNDIDYTILNPVLHLQLPSMILFKDTINFDSKIEIIHRNSIRNSVYFQNKLNFLDEKAFLVLDEGFPPLIENTFSVYINNKKVPSDAYDIINRRTLVFKKATSSKNVLVKFYYEDNDEITEKLLELYNVNKSPEDIKLDSTSTGSCIIEYLKQNKVPNYEETDKEEYLGLKYINQLSIYYQYLMDLYKLTKLNTIKDFDANQTNLYNHVKNPLTINQTKGLPTYFNHDIRINANRSYIEDRFHDNISILNPSRIFQLYNYVDDKVVNNPDEDILLDCNDDSLVQFDTYLNENIPIIVPYINNNILIDCNTSIKKEDFENNLKGCDF